MFQDTLGHIKSRTSLEIQVKAAKDVAERLLGKEISKMFIMMLETDLEPDGKDTFKVQYLFSSTMHIYSRISICKKIIRHCQVNFFFDS